LFFLVTLFLLKQQKEKKERKKLKEWNEMSVHQIGGAVQQLRESLNKKYKYNLEYLRYSNFTDTTGTIKYFLKYQGSITPKEIESEIYYYLPAETVFEVASDSIIVFTIDVNKFDLWNQRQQDFLKRQNSNKMNLCYPKVLFSLFLILILTLITMIAALRPEIMKSVMMILNE
jgi:hypothetical protein